MASLQDEPARLIGPEDVAKDQFVTIAEYQRDVVFLDDTIGETATVRVQSVTLPSGCAGEPLKVLAVSLPFVYAERPDGTTIGLDLRRERLARLSKAYGRAAFAKKRR